MVNSFLITITMKINFIKKLALQPRLLSLQNVKKRGSKMD